MSPDVLYGKWKLAGAWSSLRLPALPAPELGSCHAIRDTGHTVLSDVAAVVMKVGFEVGDKWCTKRTRACHSVQKPRFQPATGGRAGAAARASCARAPRSNAVPVAPAPGARKGHRHEAAGPAAHTSDF
jgi:hypothetical protein